MKIGIIGIGAVGGALSHCLKYFYNVAEYDPPKNIGKIDDILSTDVVCVCVPTNLMDNGHLDMSAIDETMDLLYKNAYKGLIILKSTLQVGYCSKILKKYPNIRLTYAPEYLRERSAFVFASNPDRVVIGGKDKDDIELTKQIFEWQESPFIIMSYIDAEISKLAHNAYIATKVTFTNEIANICDEYGADAENVMLGIATDRRIAQYRLNLINGLPNLNEIHMNPHGSKKISGKCVPKDTSELVYSSERAKLLRCILELNR